MVWKQFVMWKKHFSFNLRMKWNNFYWSYLFLFAAIMKVWHCSALWLRSPCPIYFCFVSSSLMHRKHMKISQSSYWRGWSYWPQRYSWNILLSIIFFHWFDKVFNEQNICVNSRKIWWKTFFKSLTIWIFQC